MSIGVAFCGCGPGAAYADAAIDYVTQKGIDIDMISASGVSSLPVLMKISGTLAELKNYPAKVDWKQLSATDKRILKDLIFMPGQDNISFSINSVCAGNGIPFAFSNIINNCGNSFRAINHFSAYDAFMSTLSPYHEIKPFDYRGYRLCDFSTRFGCPISPLKMSGIDKTILIVFHGRNDGAPSALSMQRLIDLTKHSADVLIDIVINGNPAKHSVIEEINTQIEKRLPLIYDCKLQHFQPPRII